MLLDSSSSLRTILSLKQCARVRKSRILGSSHLLQSALLLAYPVAAVAAIVAVEATASSEVPQMAPGQFVSQFFLFNVHCFYPYYNHRSTSSPYLESQFAKRERLRRIVPVVAWEGLTNA